MAKIRLNSMKRKINSLQGLRVMAMIIIFLYHAELFPFGHFAVTFFFILSGFVAYYSNSSSEKLSISNSMKYCINRIKKFYLVYLLTLLLGLIVNSSIFSDYEFNKKILIILSNLTLTQSFIPSPDYYFSLNGVGWYLSSLGFCYLIFNLYKRLLNNIKMQSIILVIILWSIQLIISGLSVNLSYDETQWILYINPVMRSINFFMGMIFAKIFIEKESVGVNKNNSYTKYELMLLALFAIIYICSIFIPRAFIWSVYYAPIIMLIIYTFSFENCKISRFLRKNTFIKLAGISFEFYMIHQLIINICWRLIGKNKLIIASLSLGISFTLAMLLNSINTKVWKLNKMLNDKINY